MGSSEPTVTSGIISALHRSLPRTTQRDKIFSDLIQTDAAINPGNSGGPLVNLNGEIIGINVAIFTTSGGSQGIGFAVPINTAKRSIDKLISGREVLYGWLGVSIQDIDEDLAEYFGISDRQGALVVKVLEDSPAQKARLKEGDVIRAFNQNKIKDVRQLITLVSQTEVGTKVTLEIIRNKKTITLPLTIGKRPLEISEVAAAETWRGLKVEALSSDIVRMYNLDQSQGVVVVEVQPGSSADDAGLMPGDLIVRIGDFYIKNLADYQQAISKVKGEVLVKTARGYLVLMP